MSNTNQAATLPEQARAFELDATLRELKSLYSITGNIKDANTLLINVNELRALIKRFGESK